jgi:hypothetical protein
MGNVGVATDPQHQLCLCGIPVVAQHDCESFRDFLNPDLPDTYDEWLKLHSKEGYNLASQGRETKEVKIYPNEFFGFCLTRGDQRNLKMLENFAIEKGSGHIK